MKKKITTGQNNQKRRNLQKRSYTPRGSQIQPRQQSPKQQPPRRQPSVVKKGEKTVYDEIIFAPDPRTYQNETIGGDDIEHNFISIQLGSNGEFESNASHSAILERGEDGFYELCLVNLEKGHYEPWRVFSDTYNVKTVCDRVEQLFEDGHLQVHFIEGERKPILIPAKSRGN